MSNIKPCPFCGSQADWNCTEEPYNTSYVVYVEAYIQCENDDCGAKGPSISGSERDCAGDKITNQLIDLWNRRE